MEKQRRGQQIFLVLAAGLCLAACIFYNRRPLQQGRDFTFQKVESQEALEQTGNTSWLYGPGTVEPKTDAQFRGALLALFGRPLWEMENYEAAYEYIILAVSRDGTEYLLTAYQGPSGAAVGGNPDQEGIEDAAAALCELLMTSTPADYEAEMVYEDTHTRIRYGCRDGVPYAETEEEELWL